MSLQNRLRGAIFGALFTTTLIFTSTVPALAAPNHGGTLTWLVTPEPASIIPLTVLVQIDKQVDKFRLGRIAYR